VFVDEDTLAMMRRRFHIDHQVLAVDPERHKVAA
jgi:hypothetical protein